MQRLHQDTPSSSHKRCMRGNPNTSDPNGSLSIEIQLRHNHCLVLYCAHYSVRLVVSAPDPHTCHVWLSSATPDGSSLQPSCRLLHVTHLLTQALMTPPACSTGTPTAGSRQSAVCAAVQYMM